MEKLRKERMFCNKNSQRLPIYEMIIILTKLLRIEELRQREELYQKYLAVLTVEQPKTLSDALWLSTELDDYEIVPEDDYEYGQAVLRRHGATEEVLAKLIGYMNMEGLGADARADDGVRKTEYGSIRRCSEPFPDITQEMNLGGM